MASLPTLGDGIALTHVIVAGTSNAPPATERSDDCRAHRCAVLIGTYLMSDPRLVNSLRCRAAFGGESCCGLRSPGRTGG